MKGRTNITIDLEKQALFNALQPIHGKNLSEFIDEALDSLIGEIAPDAIIELQIQETEIKLAALKEGLIEARLIAKQRQSRKKADTSKVQVKEELDTRLESFREEKFNSNKKSLAIQYKKHNIDWKRVAEIFEFSSQVDVKEYIVSRLKEEKLIQ
jgi:hypothetical protein